ncbi:type I restriction-modification system subunit M [Latilactobacillus curvatus]|uniref:type I restriction-modification system subunit M n=1 Tax=Latilactobacillus curvatus TaxID=28038 RepID=UPI00223C2BB5|nr:class I SAM-dependent DNA methyltransferase [Latilactobacillus curvatus]MCS8581811.1 SAM-dependent DNA methyltransferase [Latilactobacillus curvatus]MCS8605716.1 SAM-dependent DNA methyltransferase [Latilactobacillus curvatus]
MVEKIKTLYEDKSINISQEVKMVLDIANKLRGTYKAEDYQDVIIPMIIIRRFECALEETKDKVVERFKKDNETPDKILKRISGFDFYNTSEFDLKKLEESPDTIAKDFDFYLKSFSQNIRTILFDLDFFDQIKKLDNANKLLLIIKDFARLDLSPKTVDPIRMGYIFEDVLRRYSENVNAGDHYTPREVVRCLVNVLLAEGSEDIYEPGKIIKVGDFACGTGGMISTTYDFIHRHNNSAKIYMYGQEILDKSYAVCVANMLIKGQDSRNIQQKNTLKYDAFPDDEFRFVIMNPPFGTPWSGDKAETGTSDFVKNDAYPDDEGKPVKGKKMGRFTHKVGKDGPEMTMTPTSGDAQLLFMQHALYKLNKKNGRAAIITNGSPLFSGGTSSGESQIRRWLLENDLVEAIIGFPDQLFYNTGISIYAFILSYNKRPERQGKVQFINATSFYQKMRKSMGNKRNELSDEHIKKITELYASFEENEYSKIFPNEEFMYQEFSVYQPMQRNYQISEERIQNIIDSNVLSNYYDPDKLEELGLLDPIPAKEKKELDKFQLHEPLFEELIKILRSNIDDTVYKEPKLFENKLFSLFKDFNLYPEEKTEKAGINKTKKYLKDKISFALSKIDKTAVIQTKRDGSAEIDKSTKDTELIPMSEEPSKYFEREVKPFVPDYIPVFEENLTGRNMSIKTGAEFPFTRYFYEYQAPEKSDVLINEFKEVSKELTSLMKEFDV